MGGLPGALGSLRPVLEQATRDIFRTQGIDRYSVSVTFLGDGEMAKLNKDSLGREGPTDVIAFDLSEEGLPLERVGDIYISLDTALANSERFGVDRSEELLRLVVHGALHVLGHEDTSSSKRREMEALQEQYVEKFSGDLRQVQAHKEDD
jgi:rRNA maturation RNase YbeY